MVEHLGDADLPKSSFESCGSTAALSSHSHVYGAAGSDNSSSFSSCSNASTDRTSGSSTRRSSWERGVAGNTNMNMPPPTSTITSKPHKAHDGAWAAIRSMKLHRPHSASLGISSFRVLRRLGHGDIGSVFLAQLRGHECLFAIKVMDKDALSKRNKLQRMHTERGILESVDHPFLPTLYAHFETEQFSCLVMEYCPGGDLHALRQAPSGKRFGIKAARFYAAEVLMAMEYLHMLGIVYRDLKPENVLVRDDGHIMLTDFDLCLKCDVKPTVLKSTVASSVSSLSTLSSPSVPSSLLSSSSGRRRLLRSFSQSSSSSTTSFLQHGSAASCMLPAACSIHPIVSCLSLGHKHHQKKQQAGSHGLSLKALKSHRLSTSGTYDCPQGQFASISEHGSSRLTFKQDVGNLSRRSSQAATIVPNIVHEKGKEGLPAKPIKNESSQEDVMILELIAEPTQARSMSFVGTHEYLSPEMIAGQGHGSAVDWWTFGIFLYELVYGRTPFKGATNDQTLINILRQELKFPDWGAIEGGEDAKSLIQGLLNKDPTRRLGSIKGAAEIKQHAFFKGINWALIRCTKPPEVPITTKYHHQSHEDNRHHNNNDHHHQQQHQHHHQNSKTNFFTYSRTNLKPVPHFEYF